MSTEPRPLGTGLAAGLGSSALQVPVPAPLCLTERSESDSAAYPMSLISTAGERAEDSPQGQTRKEGSGPASQLLPSQEQLLQLTHFRAPANRLRKRSGLPEVTQLRSHGLDSNGAHPTQ